jgi:hypothetical protein
MADVPSVLSTTFTLTLSALTTSAPDLHLRPGMTEPAMIAAIEEAGHKHTHLSAIFIKSTPEGVQVVSDSCSEQQVVEVLSAAVARISRIVSDGIVH